MRFQFAALCALALLLGSATVRANELDNEKSVTNQQIQLSKDLPQTLVVRTNLATKAVEILNVNEKLGTDLATQANIATRTFTPAPAVGVNAGAGELDHDSSSSSWYFCFNQSWYYPTYYYYGYSYAYSPYSYYSWGGYSYSYYRWSYWF